MKQKAALFMLILGLAIGLVSATVVVALPGGTAFAQIEPEDGSDTGEDGDDGGGGAAASTDADPCSTVPSGWSKTLAACQEAVESGGDPCQAIYDVLEADGNDAAQERKEACENAGSASSSDGETPPEEIPPAEDKCDPSKETCCGKVRTSIITGNFCNEDGDDPNAPENSAIFGLLKIILQIMTAGVGVAAVGGIAYGAILYASAENKPDQTKKAIGIITNVVIGIVAYAMMYLLLNFLIPGGIFN